MSVFSGNSLSARPWPVASRNWQGSNAFLAVHHLGDDGCCRGLEAFGLGEDDVPVHATSNDRPTAGAALTALVSARVPPTALLAMSDRITPFAMQWLANRGIAVPGDVSIVGFDGVPEAATARPGLTTVAQPLSELARRAVGAILDGAMPDQRQLLEVALTVGRTTPSGRLISR